MLTKICLVVLSCYVNVARNERITSDNPPPYIKQCYEGDPDVINCFISALHHLQPYLANGIKEIELPSVEPFLMDELSLSLTGGPNGYTISLKDMKIYGASNFSMSRLKLSENGKPFEAKINIPSLKINARYESSGVLIILPASGNGTFLGQFDDLDCMLKGKTITNEIDGEKYLRVDTLHVDLTVKKMRMMVKNIFKNNRILTEAINLFLRENGQEVFKVMLPQLRKKLANLFMNISNKLLMNIPLDVFYVPVSKQAKH
ncbi:protein takeout-like [Anthonomus grandis grandis]|uniref:protein takeout-like n=1 Tax=Anthonomus grandis grandis TaxID=2921223 RepID=UPI0021655A02|nr:protein takeout-like [Anthonomus grandis grandis]